MPRKRATMKEATLDTGLDGFASAFRDSATRELNKAGIVVLDNIIDDIYGIPLTGNIPLQYLLGVDVLPLERTISLVGKKGTLKSTMGFYLAKLVLKHTRPGVCFFIDAELKTNYDMVRGLVQNDKLLEKFMYPTEIIGIEQLIRSMTAYGKEYDKMCPNRNIPALYLVDSLGALTSDAAVAAMEKSGSATDVSGFDNARRAADLTEHFRAWVPKYLRRHPVVLVYINHSKFKINQGGGANFRPGPPEKTSPGGDHKDYMNTATIELSPDATRTRENKTSVAYAQVWMKTLKAALAPTGRKISVALITKGPKNERYPDGDILCKHENKEDVQRYYLEFDWDTSLVEMIVDAKGTGTAEKAAKDDIVDIRGSGQSLSSKTLGLDNVTPKVLGAAIHADKTICKALQEVFGILRKREVGS
jgi:RecA/RadA recombinase